MKKKYVQVCPRCGSDNVGEDLTSPSMAIGVPNPTICHECGYTALVFPEIEESEKKNSKKN